MWFIIAAIFSGLFFPLVFASYVCSGSPWVPVVFPRVLLALFSPHLFDIWCVWLILTYIFCVGWMISTATCCGHVLFSPYREVFWRTNLAMVDCIFVSLHCVLKEVSTYAFYILHLFLLSVCQVFPPPNFLLAVSKRQYSRQPDELEKIRFETGKSLFSSEGGCLL